MLIVDDEPLIRWALVETLAAAGHETIEADDGAAALRAVRSPRAVDVDLLDYRLPDSNDFTLLSTLKTIAPDTAIILMTAEAAPGLAEGALRRGVYRVLRKPFDVVGCRRSWRVHTAHAQFHQRLG